MPIPQSIGKFNQAVTNQITKTFAGRVPGFAILIHRGRKSGKEYRIPINAFHVGNEFLFALTYGPDTDWAKNVQAAGGCQLIAQGRLYTLTNPRIEDDPQRRWLPLPARLLMRLINAPLSLRMTQAT